ncbi:MAG: hypothetical protein QM767_11435 [Anaeromyxobacter sp.]
MPIPGSGASRSLNAAASEAAFRGSADGRPRPVARPVSATLRQAHHAGENTLIEISGSGLDAGDAMTGDPMKAVLLVAVLGASDLTYAEPMLHQDCGPGSSRSNAITFRERGPVKPVMATGSAARAPVRRVVATNQADGVPTHQAARQP